VSESASWADRWRVVTAPGTTWADASRRGPGRASEIERIRCLRAGDHVAIHDPRLFAKRRGRAFVRRAGLVIDREYLAFPSVRAPAYIVEDAPGPATYFFDRVAVVPPGVAALSVPAALALRLARILVRYRAVRGVLGRVTVGRVA